MKKVAVITGTRAEFGLLLPLLTKIHRSPTLALQLYVTGTHLSEKFGRTIDEIEGSGLPITATVDVAIDGGSKVDICASLGIATREFAKVFNEHQPDLVIVLGDRFEIFGAAQAAAFLGIDIGHLHGGEVTEGAFDEFIRHAITKMSRLHFVASADYAKRVVQLGEHPNRVFNVGAAGLDGLTDLGYMSIAEIGESLKFPLRDNFFLFTYHPETSCRDSDPVAAMGEVLVALKPFLRDHQVVMTYPNPDLHGSDMIAGLKIFAAENPQVLLTSSLGRKRYLSALKHCRLVIGNSSSGLIEAPYFQVPTVNIGDRQKGRLQASSVIQCAGDHTSVGLAIRKALGLTPQQLADTVNPYGSGQCSEKVIAVLNAWQPSQQPKSFYDLNFKLAELL